METFNGDRFNGDSSHIYVPDPYFSLDNLNPGRNYSIGIQAVSKGIESIEVTLFQATSKYNKLVIRQHLTVKKMSSLAFRSLPI